VGAEATAALMDASSVEGLDARVLRYELMRDAHGALLPVRDMASATQSAFSRSARRHQRSLSGSLSHLATKLENEINDMQTR
jgi:hypothetical protein